MKKTIMRAVLAAVLVLCMTVPASAAQWQQTNGRYWYQRDDGSYPANTWEQIGGDWYHFDENGYMQTGWYVEYVQSTMPEVHVYYLDPASGKMLRDTYVRDYNEMYGEMYDFYINPMGRCGDKEYPLQEQAFWRDFNYSTEHTDWNAVLNKWGDSYFSSNDVSDDQLEQQVTWDNDIDDSYLENQVTWTNDIDDRYLENQVTWTNDIDDRYLENQSWGDQGGEY